MQSQSYIPFIKKFNIYVAFRRCVLGCFLDMVTCIWPQTSAAAVETLPVGQRHPFRSPYVCQRRWAGCWSDNVWRTLAHKHARSQSDVQEKVCSFQREHFFAQTLMSTSFTVFFFPPPSVCKSSALPLQILMKLFRVFLSSCNTFKSRKWAEVSPILRNTFNPFLLPALLLW